MTLRLKRSGILNPNEKLTFSFNGKKMHGLKGDTLASALLANGKHMVARSFKYHRPRGIFTAGSEEPSALVRIDSGARTEPNTKATTVELYEGLASFSQNHVGSLEFDLMELNDFLSPFLSTGFYYKTFMWPKSFWEKVYEPFIRRAAGLGSLSGKPDPSIYDKGFLHCDILIIGGGAIGLSTALLAGRSGAKVILADEDFLFGGSLLSAQSTVNEQDSISWVNNVLNELESLPNVRLMSRTTIYGVFDHGIFGALEKKTDHLPPKDNTPRQVLWRVYSKKSILCSGSSERSIAFPNNDRPGIMLANAARKYVNRWGVIPGKKITVFTNNSDGWNTATQLRDAGCNVIAIIDTNEQTATSIDGIKCFRGKHIINTSGHRRISSIQLNDGTNIQTDFLAVSGGQNPNLQLTCHHRGKPIWNRELLCFVPRDPPVNMHVAGAANGIFEIQEAIKQAHSITKKVLHELDYKTANINQPEFYQNPYKIHPFICVKSSRRSWVDLQNDVTTKDIKQSHQEGFHSVEHLKRYTTLGMATDQGKTSNVLGLMVMAEHKGTEVPNVGTTIYRPPYSPVSIGALAGRARGKNFHPFRLTPSHEWAKEQGAIFVEAGNWLRAQWYPKQDETFWRQSVDREVTETRKSVGICDVTTLGKIDIKGRDSGEFLNFVYANNFGKLDIGKTRYGLMLREDGIVFDDGTTARLNKNHFIMTTTTANAVSVFRHLEFCRQCLCPRLDVHLISTTDYWAQFAVAGPNSRRVLDKVVDKAYSITNENFPFMACMNLTVFGGVQARLFRISFSGELAYELAVPRGYGDAVIRELMKVGEEFNIVPYGTEALGVMRVEKGHAAGNELNGQTTAQMLGMGKMVSKLNDCIGNTMSERVAFNDDENGLNLVGFVPCDKSKTLVAGAHFIKKGKANTTINDEGWMTSIVFSPSLNHSIGLGFIKKGNKRLGEKVKAVDLLGDNSMEVKIVSPHFIDPKGERLRV